MFNYPKVRKEDIKEEHFGVVVEDPYRWLEDDTSEETTKFVEDQVAFTNEYLSKIDGRDKVEARLKELYDYEKYSGFMVSKNKILYNYNSGLEAQYSWYIQDGLEGEAKLLVDPNTLSEDGTVAVSFGSFSPEGRYLPYLISESGSDWKTLRIIDLETGELLEDEINWLKFTNVSWNGEEGFYYSNYDAPTGGSDLSDINEYMKVRYHKLGDKQEDDVVIFEDDKHPLRYNYFNTSKNAEDKILDISEGTYGNEISLYDEESSSFKKIFDGFDSEHNFLAKYDGKLLFITDEDAPNMKIVSYDVETGEVEDFLEESNLSLEFCRLIGDYLVTDYLEDVASKLIVRNLKTGEVDEVELPELGNVLGISGSEELGGFLYSYSSFLSPTTIYFYDFETKKSTIFKQSQVPFDKDDFVTERCFVQASDGAKVPMFLTYKKGLEKNGDNKTLLYAYGGFSISLGLSFSPANIYLAEQGGIYAQANIRGGNEYGDKWHRQGMKLNKQRVFDDFIECAEYLIEENYTSTEKLAIEGGSNGGLLMGAVTNQRPDLFRVVFPSVGVMDMLRYHLFTVGWGWIPEFGSPEDEEYFHYIYKYSPLHNIEEKDYPSIMIRTADHDDRVVPAHSFKYGATLQEKNTSDNPVLIRIDSKAGHGSGKSTEMVIKEKADSFAFMFYEMGLEI